MGKYKLGVDLGMGYGQPVEVAAKAVAAAGFDACFTGWGEGCDVEGWANTIAREGLIYQSIHSPFTKVHKMWEEGDEGEAVTDMLIACVNDCAKVDVPVMVVHPIIGMDKHNPTDLGITRYARLVEAAEKAGVKLGFENVEGPEYLAKIMQDLGGSSAVGFCWDTGHEMCYNFSRDMMALYGDKLVATHFNDNMGMTDPNVVTWHDDAHLLPFDGIADWAGIMARINRHGYEGILTFELTCKNKPNKHTHDAYAEWTIEEFAAQAYARAIKVAALGR
ncbi:MAG: sugar phosphate isomerase/epimerase [Clostridia bacterium]|nr:sugar phosphate isomerase/epimerase [Clostridia bacterium]